MIDWNDLRYFLAVARSGSTAGAARQLGVNQSTVVRRIAMLEEGLGLRLFDRKRDGYRATPEGEALLEEAAAVETSVQTFTRRAGVLDGAIAGSLRVTTVAMGVAPQLVHEFQRRHPRIKVSLMIEDRYNDLSDGRAEVALRAGPPHHGHLVGRKLSDQAWAVYGSRGYVEHWGRPATPEDLNNHRMVGFEGAIEDITAARWLRAVAPRCELACRSSSVHGMLMAAQSGFGLALLPCEIGEAGTDLVRVVDPQPGLTGGFWILTHPDLRKRPNIRAFFDFMAEEIVKYRPLLTGRPPSSQGSAEETTPLSEMEPKQSA